MPQGITLPGIIMARHRKFLPEYVCALKSSRFQVDFISILWYHNNKMAR